MCECVAKETFDSKQLNQAPKEENKRAKKRRWVCVGELEGSLYINSTQVRPSHQVMQSGAMCQRMHLKTYLRPESLFFISTIFFSSLVFVEPAWTKPKPYSVMFLVIVLGWDTIGHARCKLKQELFKSLGHFSTYAAIGFWRRCLSLVHFFFLCQAWVHIYSHVRVFVLLCRQKPRRTVLSNQTIKEKWYKKMHLSKTEPFPNLHCPCVGKLLVAQVFCLYVAMVSRKNTYISHRILQQFLQ